MAETTLHRAMPTQLERVDQRTLACRYCPFGVRANAIDPLPDGGIDRYVEEFASTVFNRQLSAAEKADGVIQRITLIDEHHEGLGKVGFTTELRREADGIYGVVRLLPSKIDDVTAMLDEGVDKLSVEFTPFRGGTKMLPDGTRLRTDAHLHRVALVAQGAYTGSEVLALREAAEEVAAVDAAYEADMNELDAWLAAEQATQQRWAERLTTT